MDWTFRANQPIYAQLVEKIQQSIISGVLPPGSRLAPVRELAMEAGVNPNTMQRALQELEREGLVYSQRTSGRFVTEDDRVIAMQKETLAKERVRAFLASMAELGFDLPSILSLIKEE